MSKIVQSCVVCYNNSKNNKEVSFHQFPKNKVKQTLWLKALSLTSVSSWQKVCSKHFSDNDFRFSYNRHILQSTAVPISIYKPVEEHSYAQNVLTSSSTFVRFSNNAMTSGIYDSLPSPFISRIKNYEKENIVEISQPILIILCTNVNLFPSKPSPEKIRRIWSSS